MLWPWVPLSLLAFLLRFPFGLGCLRLRGHASGGAISAVAVLGAGQHGRFSLGSLGSDDDRVRQVLRAALVAEDLVGLGPAGALERNLLQLALELFLRELTALQPRT